MIQKIAFTMYPVSDVPRARKFYEETLGLTPGLAGGREGRWWIEYDLPGGGCLAITNTTGGQPGGGTVALEVLDLDRMIFDLKAKDVEFKSDLIHGPNCRMAVCVDTEGNQLVLHQLNSKPRAAAQSKPARAKAVTATPAKAKKSGRAKAEKPAPEKATKPAPAKPKRSASKSSQRAPNKMARGKAAPGKTGGGKPATRSRKASKR
jgi:predicted enzyme related to lactoylglutathione lyase